MSQDGLHPDIRAAAQAALLRLYPTHTATIERRGDLVELFACDVLEDAELPGRIYHRLSHAEQLAQLDGRLPALFAADPEPSLRLFYERTLVAAAPYATRLAQRQAEITLDQTLGRTA